MTLLVAKTVYQLIFKIPGLQNPIREEDHSLVDACMLNHLSSNRLQHLQESLSPLLLSADSPPHSFPILCLLVST